MSGIQSNVATVRFLTGSTFEGSWNNATHMMDGFGSYRYPDGSEYRGRFVDGKFHGYGHLKLAQPYRLTIKGEFQEGKLMSIEDMWFNDGLQVTGSFQNDQFVCDDWDYLTPNDRRYQSERFYGLQPVGPTSYLTSNLPARDVPHDCYDVEEGLFNAESGWLFERPTPFTKSVYVGCPHEKAWIKRHCRGERKEHINEPLPSFCRQIINNNLETEQSQLKDITIYAPDKTVQRERYFPKLCREPISQFTNQKQQQQQQPPSKRLQYQPVTATELCMNAHYEKEQKRAEEHGEAWIRSRQSGKMPPAERARIWTSSSEPLDGDSGATQTLSQSLTERSLHTNVKDFFGTASTMIDKKATESLHVVQSNMKRPGSFVDITRSLFEL